MPVRPQQFAARWSLSVWIVTVVAMAVAIFVVAVVARLATHGLPEGDAGRPLMLIAGFVPVAVLCVTVFFAPLAYTVGPGAVVVNRMGPDFVVAVAEIVDVRRVGPRDVGFVVRLFGSGGFFGGFGRFYSRRLRHFRAYTTNGKDLVLISLANGGKVLISPHPADAFVEILQRACQAE